MTKKELKESRQRERDELLEFQKEKVIDKEEVQASQ
jgi:hypothetical protein